MGTILVRLTPVDLHVASRAAALRHATADPGTESRLAGVHPAAQRGRFVHTTVRRNLRHRRQKAQNTRPRHLARDLLS
jgi:hypothetical protein